MIVSAGIVGLYLIVGVLLICRFSIKTHYYEFTFIYKKL
jgi:hypothetical protein